MATKGGISLVSFCVFNPTYGPREGEVKIFSGILITIGHCQERCFIDLLILSETVRKAIYMAKTPVAPCRPSIKSLKGKNNLILAKEGVSIYMYVVHLADIVGTALSLLMPDMS